MDFRFKQLKAIATDQSGATAVLIALILIVLIGFAALALDVGHLVVTKNELQNAADAGALAGAHKLYSVDGRQITADLARTSGVTVSRMNRSDNSAVDVDTGDVVIGHWSFGLGALPKGFTPSTSYDLVPLWGVDTATLDGNADFINAVKVTAWRRDENRVTLWLFHILELIGLGPFDSVLQSASAVAYIGYAGSVDPETFEQPIAICRESLLQRNVEGEAFWDCNIGRMLNSSTNDSTSNTGAWTNMTQDPCETASVPTLRPLICGSGNPTPMLFGQGMGAIGGVADNVFRDFANCWRDNTTDTNGDDLPEDIWPELKLPVVSCPGNNVSNCPELVGVVVLDVIWVERDGNLNNIDDSAPKEMTDPRTGETWPTADDRAVSLDVLREFYVGRNAGDQFPTEAELANYTDRFDNGKVRWASFVRKFDLLNADDQAAPWQHKAIYFMPNCDYHEPDGTSQGENFGVLALIPGSLVN